MVIEFTYFCNYVSQGSVATRCRRGGKYNTCLVANFPLSLIVK